MASYSIRVVIHRAAAEQYLRLHEAMAKLQCSRRIRGDDGIWYDLPDGNYQLYSNAPIESVLVAVKHAAATAASSSSVLVAEVVQQRWVLRPLPGQS